MSEVRNLTSEVHNLMSEVGNLTLDVIRRKSDSHMSHF